MEWQVFDSGFATAEENMALDQKLLNSLHAQSDPILHFYDWKDNCATYGYFTDPGAFLNLDRSEKLGLQLARRPTGGGILFHLTDFAYSILIPANYPNLSLNTLDNYLLVNTLVSKAIGQFLGNEQSLQLLQQEKLSQDLSSNHFCMAKPTKYDILIDGCKVAGGAQRRTKLGLLHQGTIALSMPSEGYLLDVLLPGTCVMQSMLQQSYFLLGQQASDTEIQEARKQLKNLLIQAFTC